MEKNEQKTSTAVWAGILLGIGIGFFAGYQFAKYEESQKPSSRKMPDPRATTEEIVDHWYDGDTVTLKNGEKIRLYGIDTPEIKSFGPPPPGKTYPEPGAIEARDFVRKYWPKGTKLKVRRRGKGKYGRTLAVLEDENGNIINEELMRRGLAREYPGTR